MSKPLVSVILCHHLDENRPYLNRALESVVRSQGVPFETLLLADSETCPDAPEEVTIVHDRALNTAIKKGHHGIKMAQGDYFLFLSDDVIVSKDCMATLVQTTGDTALVNPMSNSDLGTRFGYPLSLKKGDEIKPLHPDCDLEEMRGWEEAIMNYQSPFGPLVVKQDWISFYCTLVPKKIWDAVGLMDERLETRHNDEDYCYRARAKLFPSAVNFGAFAFHYGTKTLSKTVKPSEQAEASRVFAEKWRLAS